MSRKAWKRILIISILLFILTAMFVIGIWAIGNGAAALAAAILNGLEYHYESLGEFLLDFVGSPVFWVCAADLAVIVCAAVMLIITKKSRGVKAPSQRILAAFINFTKILDKGEKM